MSHRDSVIKNNKELSKPMDLMNVGFTGSVAPSEPAYYDFLEYQQNDGTKDGFWKLSSDSSWTYTATSGIVNATALGITINYGNADHTAISGVTAAGITGIGIDNRHSPVYIWFNRTA